MSTCVCIPAIICKGGKEILNLILVIMNSEKVNGAKAKVYKSFSMRLLIKSLDCEGDLILPTVLGRPGRVCPSDYVCLFLWSAFHA